MKDIIIGTIQQRIEAEITPRSNLGFMLKTPIEKYYDVLINTVYVFTRPRKSSRSLIMFSEVIAGIGHRIRGRLGLPKNTAIAARMGAFLLWTFEDMGMLRVVLAKGKRGHAQYSIELLDDEPLSILWRALPDAAVDKLPAFQPHEDWTSAYRSDGTRMMKTNDTEALDALNPTDTPMIFRMMNRAQQVGWQVNSAILPVYHWCMNNKAAAFMDIWEAQNRDARVTKLREVRTIADMATRLKDRTFYHSYYLDFRGRKYPATAYLHEQGSDFARSLLYRTDRKPMTQAGFSWLQIYLASNWAGDAGRLDKLKTDKIPIKDRIEWATHNESAMLQYAEAPTVHHGWMEADAPWQFLAGCMELRRLRLWQIERGDLEDYSMPTGYEAYIDGSNNGCQHLAALTKDEIVAPHVNLVPLALPGDLYRYVGGHAWKTLATMTEGYSKQLVNECRRIIVEVKRMKTELDNATNKDLRQILHAEAKDFRSENQSLLDAAAPIYWLRFNEPKEQRKLVKRNVMTIPYGGTAYGLGQQQIEDAPKHGFSDLRYLERKWGSVLGRVVYEDCRVSLARPMRLLGVLEAAGAQAGIEGRFLRWRVPITNLLVVQHYTEGVVNKIWVQYGPPQGEKRSTGYYSNTYQIALTFPEDQVPSPGKQSTGASPNGIHSYDAGHLTMTTDACDFPVTTIHDSFGALLPDMPVLFKEVRRQFVRFYAADPLTSLMRDVGADIANVAVGNLDISLIQDSDYAFL